MLKPQAHTGKEMGLFLEAKDSFFVMGALRSLMKKIRRISTPLDWWFVIQNVQGYIMANW